MLGSLSPRRDDGVHRLCAEGQPLGDATNHARAPAPGTACDGLTVSIPQTGQASVDVQTPGSWLPTLSTTTSRGNSRAHPRAQVPWLEFGKLQVGGVPRVRQLVLRNDTGTPMVRAQPRSHRHRAGAAPAARAPLAALPFPR
jgi:hypothetical protein